jgi:hypothetical protein
MRIGDKDLVRQLMPDASTMRRRVKFWLTMAAVAVLVVVIARPQMGSKISNEKRNGIESLYGESLYQTRHTLQKDVTIAKKRDKQRLDEVFLSNNHLVHTSHQVGDKTALLFYPSVKLADIY